MLKLYDKTTGEWEEFPSEADLFAFLQKRCEDLNASEKPDWLYRVYSPEDLEIFLKDMEKYRAGPSRLIDMADQAWREGRHLLFMATGDAGAPFLALVISAVLRRIVVRSWILLLVSRRSTAVW